jgi:starch phosphorylase
MAAPSDTQTGTVAYFSMEMALDPRIPTYAGGLGVLAGDTLRAAADLGVPMVGITLVHRKGYFRQRLDAQGRQLEEADAWDPAGVLERLDTIVPITIEGRRVLVGAWRHWVPGVGGSRIPVYLLDTAVPENSAADQSLTDGLYAGDDSYRLAQEVVLGYGGVALLEGGAQGHVETYHMNEGHSALLALALVERLAGPTAGVIADARLEEVRRRCVFTTHTPVPAGHDQFPRDLVARVLGPDRARLLMTTHCCSDGNLNMTYLALRLSRYVNGVAMRHGEVSRGLFPGYPVRAITNGVHAVTWTAPPFRQLYDEFIPEWRRDNLYLRYAIGIPGSRIRDAHADAKRRLLGELDRRLGVRLDEHALTLGFARRATRFKRPDLLLADLDRVRRIVREAGPLQVVYAGKAHPRDEEGKLLIAKIHQAAAALSGTAHVVYVPDYDMEWGQLFTSGVDVWVNTPHRPLEASGTSGMKAALNGVPSLSVLDGWWIEGCVEGATGWAVGREGPTAEPFVTEAASLYDKLEQVVAPLYYQRPEAFAEVRRQAIAINGSFFNAQRMLDQYLLSAYRRETPDVANADEPRLDEGSDLTTAHMAERTT